MKTEKLHQIEKSTEARFEALPLYEFPKQLTMAEVNFLLLVRLFDLLNAIKKMLHEMIEDIEDDTDGAPQETDGEGDPKPKKRGRKKSKKNS